MVGGGIVLKRGVLVRVMVLPPCTAELSICILAIEIHLAAPRQQIYDPAFLTYSPPYRSPALSISESPVDRPTTKASMAVDSFVCILTCTCSLSGARLANFSTARLLAPPYYGWEVSDRNKEVSHSSTSLPGSRISIATQCHRQQRHRPVEEQDRRFPRYLGLEEVAAGGHRWVVFGVGSPGGAGRLEAVAGVCADAGGCLLCEPRDLSPETIVGEGSSSTIWWLL
jgi:hypothetical protein